MKTRTVKKWKWWLFVIILLGGLATLFDRWRTWKEDSHDAVIIEAAERYGVDAALIKAVVWRESRFNPRAKGRKGEVGLMQIRAEAASEWAKAEHIALFTHYQLFDRTKNVMAGTWYLARLLGRYQRTDNPVPYALADYNAGRAHVLRWNKGAAATNSAAFVSQIDFPSTKDYVRAVMKRHEHYRRVFPPKKNQVARADLSEVGLDASRRSR